MLADNPSGQLGLSAKSRLSSQRQQKEWPAEDTRPGETPSAAHGPHATSTHTQTPEVSQPSAPNLVRDPGWA